MKISSVRVRNFRLLQTFEIFLEDDLSVVIGKNNTGKTSLLLALGKFLGFGESRRLYYDDISTEERKRQGDHILIINYLEGVVTYIDL